MNARRGGGARGIWIPLGLLAAALLAAMSAPCARAYEPLAALAAAFQDPLRSVPGVIVSGAILPGDGGPAPCPAQKDFAVALTLGEVLDLALCNNAQIQVSWANIKVQAAAAGEARAAYLPTLSGTLSRVNDQTRYPDTGINASTVVSHTASGSLSWRLFDFGGREANRKGADLVLEAALFSHDAALQKTLAEVVQAYFDGQSAKAAWQAKDLNEAIARSTLDTAQRREAKGAGAHSDTLQATTALARATLDKNRALSAYSKALSVLVYTTGLPTQTRLIVADDLEERPLQLAKGLNAWLEQTQQRHPAILAARGQLEAARYRVTATRSDSLPTLDFSTNYFENGRPGQGLTPTRTRERTVGLVLTIPIFDGFSRTYKTRGAEARFEQRGAELQDTEHQILMEVVKAHADASAALENLGASETLLAAAQDSLDVSKRKYEKGAADILEILNTQAALSDARQERIRCQAEWRSARLRLLASAGLMGRSAVTP